MQQSFKQIAYYKANSARNYPEELDRYSLINGSAFSGLYPIIQLGVRALPGTKFYLNNGETPVIVGYSGLFNIDLGENSFINALTFDEESLSSIESNDSAYLIIDIAYLGGSN